jgi:hypothetical protein
LKHLKPYKLFESGDYSDLEYDIRDIVIDLEDLGEISVYVTTTLDDKPIIIFQHNSANYTGKNLTFKFSDIEYYVFRIVKYLGEEKIDKISYLSYDQWSRFTVSLRNREIINLENVQDLDKIKSDKIVNLDIILK